MLIQRMAIGTAALVILASGLAARAQTATFTYAAYGVLNAQGSDAGEKMKDMEDVTAIIQEMISSKKAKAQYKNSMNGIFQKDPIRGKVKTLHLVLSMKMGKVLFPVDEKEIDEYDMNGLWKFIEGERAKKK